MANPTGESTFKARGKTYRLHIGMSVLGELQDELGDEFEAALAVPEDGKIPRIGVVVKIFLAALKRYHEEEADRWLVDDIIAENQDAFAELLKAAFPDPQEAKSRGGKKKAAA